MVVQLFQTGIGGDVERETSEALGGLAQHIARGAVGAADIDDRV